MQHNIQDWNQKEDWARRRQRERIERRMRRGKPGDKIWFGAFVALAGAIILAAKLDFFSFDWETMWPVVLIGLGLMIGIKKRFHSHAWWILILIGSANLIPEFTIHNTTSSNLIFPLALIIGGFMIAFRSKKQHDWHKIQVVTSDENSFNLDVTFGGRKEIVTSKQFKGGVISTTFGGCEVNMLQADSTEQPMVINVKVSFGGIELIVPSNWEIKNEIDPSFGSVEDHRAMRTANTVNTEEKKVLILRGSCTFGSVEIKSY